MGLVLAFTSAAAAQTFTTDDGVLSIETPDPTEEDTAVTKNEEIDSSEFSIRAVNETYYVITDELNDRISWSTESEIIGVLRRGEEVVVKGAVVREVQITAGIRSHIRSHIRGPMLMCPRPSLAKRNRNPAVTQETILSATVLRCMTETAIIRASW